MPLFFFDYHDGDRVLPDDDGSEFDTLQEARAEASAALGDVARDMCQTGADRTLAIHVSDAARVPLFRVAVSFSTEECGWGAAASENNVLRLASGSQRRAGRMLS